MHEVEIHGGVVMCSCGHKVHTANKYEAQKVAETHVTFVMMEIPEVKELVMNAGIDKVFTITKKED